MKLCKHCGKDKNEEEFAFRNKAKGVRRSICKECQRKRDNFYYNNSNKRKEYVKGGRKKDRERAKEFIANVKKNSTCKNCGDTRWYVLDFHHRNDSEKSFNISRGHTKGFSTLQKEIDKCDILCSNCHRELHFNMAW